MNTRKTAILEHWFGIDKILFGGNAKDTLSEDAYDNYCTTKGALLSNLFEIYGMVDYTPEDKSYTTMVEMAQASIKDATASLAEAKTILESDDVMELVRAEISETGSLEGLSEGEVARYVISKRRNAVAIDKLTMSNALTENQANLNDWQGKVLVDAHKTLRNAIIDIALY